jgi:hypothetical protein
MSDYDDGWNDGYAIGRASALREAKPTYTKKDISKVEKAWAYWEVTIDGKVYRSIHPKKKHAVKLCLWIANGKPT